MNRFVDQLILRAYLNSLDLIGSSPVLKFVKLWKSFNSSNLLQCKFINLIGEFFLKIYNLFTNKFEFRLGLGIEEYGRQISVILDYNKWSIIFPKSQCISVVPKLWNTPILIENSESKLLQSALYTPLWFKFQNIWLRLGWVY
jgi:hypothetical protein